MKLMLSKIKTINKKYLILISTLALIAFSGLAYAYIFNKPEQASQNPAEQSNQSITVLQIDSQPRGINISSNCSSEISITPYECTSISDINAELEAPLEHTDSSGQVFTYKEWQGCDTAESNKCNKSAEGNSEAKATAIYEQKSVSTIPVSTSKTVKKSMQKYCTNPELNLREYSCNLTLTEIPKLVKINIAVHNKEPSDIVRWEPWNYNCVRHDGLYEPPCTLEVPKPYSNYFTSADTAEVLVHSSSEMTIKVPEYIHSQECGVRSYSPCFSYEQYSFAGFVVSSNQGENYHVTANYNFHCYLQAPKIPSAQYPFENYKC